MMRSVMAVALSATPYLIADTVFATKDDGLTVYASGNLEDVQPSTEGALLLVGGASDQDDAMQWFVDKAGRGDIVVLRASGADGYNEWLLEKGADSVVSYVFSSREAASNPDMLESLESADGIFFAGGDQSKYRDFWKGTPVAEIVNRRAASIPIGGTSAGLAILGQFIYTGETESAMSGDTLRNPFHQRVTLDRNFLTMPYLGNVITDSHFGARDRMGRLVTFTARLARDGWTRAARGLGIDEQTAVAIDANGQAQIFGRGHAYFLSTNGTAQVCENRVPLTYQSIRVYRMAKGTTFDFTTWTGSPEGSTYVLNVAGGVMTSTRVDGSIY